MKTESYEKKSPGLKTENSDGYDEFFRDKLINKLGQIFKADPEGGLEKLSLHAARNGLRTFPQLLFFMHERSVQLTDYDKIMLVAVLWRALLAAWTFEKSLTEQGTVNNIARAASKFAAGTKDYKVNQTYRAVSAAFSAASLAVNFSTNQEDMLIAAGEAGAALQYFAVNTDVSLYEDVTGLIEEESQMFVDPDITAAQIRRMPLWKGLSGGRGNSLKEDPALQDMLRKWAGELPGSEQDAAQELIGGIIRDYGAIFSGTWSDGEGPGSTRIRSAADESTQKDIPSATDYLGRDQLVDALATRLSVPDDASHLTIGLFGDWGIGKSSVLKQVQQKLQAVKHTAYIFCEFNAWSYEQALEMHAGIAQEVISALTTARDYSKKDGGILPEARIAYKQMRYKLRILWKFAIRSHGPRMLVILAGMLLSILGGYQAFISQELLGAQNQLGNGFIGIGALGILALAGRELKTIGALPLAKELKTYLRLPSYQEFLGTIPVMSENIRALCAICLGKGMSENNRRLIFFIDDLDRCGEKGIVNTFEAVRLVLDIPWVNVIIAMDQSIALPALACNYEKLAEYHQRDPMSIARDYLAKVIHLPVQLSLPDDISVVRYLAHLYNDDGFVKIAETHKSPVSGSKEKNGPQRSQENVNGEVLDSEAAVTETIGDILSDINSVEVRTYLQDEKTTFNTVEVKMVYGFGAEQKILFYQWLIRFNLRNPRQIKRLYNSYNLLWSIYDNEWEQHDASGKAGDSAWEINMLGLLVLEMINNHVPFDRTKDTRAEFRRIFFGQHDASMLNEIEGILFEDIKDAHEKVSRYQLRLGVDLLKRLLPFVLPAIRPQDVVKHQ